jgi:hypothetical protein
VCPSHSRDEPGRQQPHVQSVYDGRQCLGHLLPRGKQGVEAFDANDRSLGLFTDAKAAAGAVWAAAHGD